MQNGSPGHYVHRLEMRVQRARALGFTLIEVMTVLAILAILAALAGPDMARFVNMRQVETVAFRLSEDLQFARSEALKRNARVLLCNGAAASDCEAAPTATSWANGWRICYDRDADGACDTGTAQDPNPMRVTPGASASARVTSGPTSRLTFDPVGTITASNLGDFAVVSVRDTAIRWTVRMAASGSVVVRKG
jgi:prepilin-type N-terminal cleavage/methylation domain-containing protein